MPNLIFLKLGGSLITDKTQPRTVRKDILQRIAAEILAARRERPGLSLLIGHGSGSFGHITAKKYGTRQGVHTPEEWLGFAEVWLHARQLNQYVIEALSAAGLPLIAFPPSAAASCQDGPVVQWEIEPIQQALHAGLIPVVNGDVVFDRVRGGTIASTEDGFAYLAPRLHPRHILLAGIDPGVWADFPQCTRLLSRITPETFSRFANGVSGSSAVDVTGGMAEKVSLMLNLTAQVPGMDASIFSGLEPGAITCALLENFSGTLVTQS
ncbi:MAG TPA: isopentenyl phosphate kinase [Anaerolineaceae bacterium]|nr:isopentenyl phosphate kinase [Anaerolineaceae bacterium]